MSEINIYINDEDKVNVKDDTQILKLQGPKGEPGPKGEDGVQGPKGEPFKFSDFTEEQLKALKGPKGNPFLYEDFTPDQLEALKGPQGDTGLQGQKGEPGKDGKPFTYDMFTQEQLKALKGPKGDKGEDGRDGASATADNAHQLLLQGNVWCESASVDDVLTALIGNMGKPFPRTEFTPLSVSATVKNQTVVSVTGEPHYTVKVVGNDTDVFLITENGSGSVTIKPLGEDDIELTYHNFTGDKVGDYTIKGVADESTVQPDETYEELGSKYSKYGRKLVINVTNQKTDNNWTRNNFNFLGKWNEQDFDTIEIVTNGKKKQHIYLYSQGLPRIPVIVNKPELITFNHTISPSGNRNINIGTKEHGINVIGFLRDTLEWSDADNRYINTGDDPL